MRSLNLMVDIDEVIFPLGDSIHAIGHEEGLHDNSMPWSMWEGWKQYGCAPHAYWRLWDLFVERDGYRTTQPIQRNLEALRHLYFEGHRINLVTARGFMANAEKIREWTPEWLEEFAVPHHTLTFAKDKVAAQAELGRFDLAIDDSPKNYAALENDGVNVWLQDHPHNRWFQIEREAPDAARLPVAVVDTMWQWAEVAAKLADTVRSAS